VAKVKLYELAAAAGGVGLEFTLRDLDLIGSSAKRAVYLDDDGDRLVFHGKGFSFDGNGYLTAGRVERAIFKDENNELYADYRDLEIRGTKVGGFFEGEVTSPLMQEMNKGADVFHGSRQGEYISSGSGKDRIFGERGNDHISGGIGSDWLKGGRGSDEFDLITGSGKDTVVDFDATGGGLEQDYIGTYKHFADFTITKVGHALRVSLGDGDTLILQNVRRSDFGMEDFHFWEGA